MLANYPAAAWQQEASQYYLNLLMTMNALTSESALLGISMLLILSYCQHYNIVKRPFEGNVQQKENR